MREAVGVPPPPPLSLTPLEELNPRLVSCRRCPRLVAHRERIAREKKREYRDWTYWGKPVPGFGDPNARLLLVGQIGRASCRERV